MKIKNLLSTLVLAAVVATPLLVSSQAHAGDRYARPYDGYYKHDRHHGDRHDRRHDRRHHDRYYREHARHHYYEHRRYDDRYYTRDDHHGHHDLSAAISLLFRL